MAYRLKPTEDDIENTWIVFSNDNRHCIRVVGISEDDVQNFLAETGRSNTHTIGGKIVVSGYLTEDEVVVTNDFDIMGSN